jgi:histidinol dehydrogenase
MIAADKTFETAFERLVQDRRESDDDVASDVADILARVKARGDVALSEYTQRFDGHQLTEEGDWRIPLSDCRAAFDALEPALRDALVLAADRIRAYHQH